MIDPDGRAPEPPEWWQKAKTAFKEYFDVGSLVNGTRSQKTESLRKISQTRNAPSVVKAKVNEGMDRVRTGVSDDMILLGETAQEVGGDAVLASAAMAATPASPASPHLATAGATTSAAGDLLVVGGELLSDEGLSSETVKNTVIGTFTRGVNKKVKGIINKTKTLGRAGNNWINNILKSTSDMMKVKTDEKLKDTDG